ncbi:MAG: hypothetical protein AVDCRST_MAG36-1131, partial [uncultured Nocardioidaceae bacterium]
EQCLRQGAGPRAPTGRRRRPGGHPRLRSVGAAPARPGCAAVRVRPAPRWTRVPAVVRPAVRLRAGLRLRRPRPPQGHDEHGAGDPRRRAVPGRGAVRLGDRQADAQRDRRLRRPVGRPGSGADRLRARDRRLGAARAVTGIPAGVPGRGVHRLRGRRGRRL